MFEHITEFPSDPILGLVEKFKKDPRSEKINLSIGLYYDEDGNIPQLEAIKKAKKIYWDTQNGPSGYLPIGGLQSYCDGSQKLIFGKDSKGIQESK
ncbi:MAG: aromatic amino acid aminotransferase, partial [Pseudopedobacter saltans]